MNTSKILICLILVLAILTTAAFSDPIGLDPGSPASPTLVPLSTTDKDNPLQLTASQQFHINARKLRFQKDATALLGDHKLNRVNKGIKLKDLEKDGEQGHS